MTPKGLIQFGISIRQWRKELGYNQEELGKLAGVSKQYISNLERAEPSSYTGEPTQPSIEVVDNLAKALKRPIQEMRDLAGYGIKETVTESDDQQALAERAAELFKGFITMTPDRQAELIGLMRVLLQSDHPELLEIMTPPIEIVDDTDLTESDVIEIEGNTPP